MMSCEQTRQNRLLQQAVLTTVTLVWSSVAYLGGSTLKPGFAQAPLVSDRQHTENTPGTDTPAMLPEPDASNLVPVPTPASADPSPIPEADLPAATQPPSPIQLGPVTLDGNYIDPTDYNLGATEYIPPSTVVLSERSTGCQTVLSNGTIQLPDSVCGNQNGSLPLSDHGSDQTGTMTYSTTVPFGPVAVSPLGGQLSHADPYTIRYYYNPGERPQGRLGNQNVQLLFPLTLPAPITSLFGLRIHPLAGGTHFHSGVDLGAPMGAPVVAAYAGRVVISDILGGYGLAVVLEHDLESKADAQAGFKRSTSETLYGHLSEVFVKPGEWVKQGEVIGRVGSTGVSTGPHLHFELRHFTPDGWVVVDPGAQLEYALSQLVKSLQVANAAGNMAWKPKNLSSNLPTEDLWQQKFQISQASSSGEWVLRESLPPRQ